MSVLSLILSFLGKILAEVLKDVLKTPAIETTVRNVEGPITTIPTPADVLSGKFKWVRDRGQREE